VRVLPRGGGSTVSAWNAEARKRVRVRVRRHGLRAHPGTHYPRAKCHVELRASGGLGADRHASQCPSRPFFGSSKRGSLGDSPSQASCRAADGGSPFARATALRYSRLLRYCSKLLECYYRIFGFRFTSVPGLRVQFRTRRALQGQRTYLDYYLVISN